MFLEVERMDYGRLLKDFEVAHLPVLFACTEELFGGQFFWKKNNLVINFCVLSQKNFIVCQKFFRMVAAIAVQKSRGTSMGRNPIPEKLCNFKIVSGFSENCLWTIAKNISAELPHLLCNGADDFFLLKYKDIRFFWVLAKKCSPVRKKINRVIAIVIQITRRTSSMKKANSEKVCTSETVFGFWVNFLRTIDKKTSEVLRYLLCRSTEEHLKTFFVESKTVLKVCGFWAKKMWLS